MFFNGGFFLGSNGGGGGTSGSGVKWKFESLANARGTDINSVTVDSYDVVNDKIMISIAGIEISSADFTKTDSTTISFAYNILDDEDIEIWNFGTTGS